MTDLAVWRDVVGPDKIEIVNFLPGNELVNLNRAQHAALRQRIREAVGEGPMTRMRART
jgi:hypothetical protein